MEKKSIARAEFFEEPKKRCRRLIAAAAKEALKEAKLGKNASRRLAGNGEQLRADIMAAVQKCFSGERFANEETKSGCGYRSGGKPKEISWQIKHLQELFPGLGGAGEEIARKPVPRGAEGWFAIPGWEKIVTDLPAARRTYGEAVRKVFDAISRARNGKFYNWREGQLGSAYLRQSPKTAKAFSLIGSKQKNRDILIVPAQLGLRHRGRSVRRALEIMAADEFGLGAFAVGIILLTHPERLDHVDDLFIDCPGDEFSPQADGFFSNAPSFHFHMGQVKFAPHYFANPNSHYGSVSGFLR